MALKTTLLNMVTGGRYGQLSALVEGEMSEQVTRLQATMRESSERLYARMKEDLQWKKLAMDAISADSLLSREEQVAWARAAFKRDAFAKRGVMLKTDFCFGSGIDGPRGKQRPGEPEDANMKALVDFWNLPANQAAMFSSPMQSKRSNQLLVDGDLFLPLFVRGGEVNVRRLGSTLVKKIITDPEDATRPLYYAARVYGYRFDAQAGGLVQVGVGDGSWYFYRDFRNDDPATDPLFGQVEFDADVYMMHVPLNCIEDGGFGESDLIASLPWYALAQQIAEDQATVSRSTAALMNRLKASTNGENALANLARSMKSTTETGGPQPPLPGSMNTLSKNLQLEVSRASTGATDAWQDGRIMRQAAAVGQGFSMHYLGDPENANLATAKSMDTPVLKMLESYQTLWRSVYSDLFGFVLKQRGVTEEVPFDIPLPNFVEPEIGETATAILDAYNAGLVTQMQAAQRTMELLGFDDIPQRLQELMEEEALREKREADEMEKALAAQDANRDAQDVGDDDNPAA